MNTGIVLALKAGNNTDNNRNDVVALFERNQARYVDVSWISAFSHERELLFYGDSIVFKISRIYHAEIPNNTLKQLNILQRIVKNKQFNWDRIEASLKKRIKILAKRLEKTRKINIGWFKYQKEKHDIKKNIEHVRNKLKSSMIQSMDATQFKQFALGKLNDEELAIKYKWNISNEDKINVIKAFEQHLNNYNLNGKSYLEFPRKQLIYWIKNKYNIKPMVPAKCCTILRKEIEIYNKEIETKIENKQKEVTKQFDVRYYLKLYNYFCVSERKFICIQKPFQLPNYLKAALFSKDVKVKDLLKEEKEEKEEKYGNAEIDDDIEENQVELKYVDKNIENKINSMSFTKLTDIFINVEMIIFSYLSYDELIQYCSEWCEIIIEYAKDYENNKNKKLKTIIFQTTDIINSKVSPMLSRITKQYQSQAQNVIISYTFELEIKHKITYAIDYDNENRNSDVEEDNLHNIDDANKNYISELKDVPNNTLAKMTSIDF
eukprot:385120_1